jgi:DNA polymerase I-like protein with 3'-5' exonuclease and polymerase domains
VITDAVSFDLYRRLASIKFNVPEEEVVPEQRQEAKMEAYIFLYGSKEYTIDQILDVFRRRYNAND